jgi:hypothetical protein
MVDSLRLKFPSRAFARISELELHPIAERWVFWVVAHSSFGRLE